MSIGERGKLNFFQPQQMKLILQIIIGLNLLTMICSTMPSFCGSLRWSYNSVGYVRWYESMYHMCLMVLLEQHCIL